MKKRVLIHSNFCKAFTGFGKNKKNIMRYLYNTGKYELFELANGHQWDDPRCNQVPWECKGALPTPQQLQTLDQNSQRMEGYGKSAIDRAVKEFKPDVYIGMEDIWAFTDYQHKPWWNKINTMIWTTLDSLPILPQAIEYAPKIKHYYVWASFAEKAMKEMGYDHIKTLRGSLDVQSFFRMNEEMRRRIRLRHNLSDEFIIGFVFRNQLRKSVPNLLDGFKLFKEKYPDSKAKLLLHTHWSEGWDINRLIEEKGIHKSDILTTYVCSKCGNYHIHSFAGQELNCPTCGSQKSLNTTNTVKGVSESQLNEIYNLMDVYCHPFTSGGQEIPIQEAKLTELITLVTNYSCGEDSCSEESGGIALDWHEYREPGTQFIKASTCPESILQRLSDVFETPQEQRLETGRKARQWVIDNFSVDVIGKQLEDIIDNMPEVDYDYESTYRKLDENYIPPKILSHEDLIIDLYKNILNDEVDHRSDGYKYWMNKLKSGMKQDQLIEHFQNVGKQNNQRNNVKSLEDILGNEDTDNRIAIVIPQSETDVLLINSLLKQFKKNYKDYNIYVFTKPEFYEYIEDNPAIHRLLPYSPELENIFNLEGIGQSKGLFSMAFYPHTTTQKSICYLHNGLNTNQFSLV